MSTSYTISLKNDRGANTNYAIFMEPPKFTGGVEPLMNVWYTSFVPYGGNIEVRTGLDFYAWVGTSPIRPQPGVVVSNGMSYLANIGTTYRPGSTFDNKIVEGFPTIEEVTPTAIDGGFEIDTGSDFPVPNDTFLIGLAKVNNRGRVAPVGVTAPRNNMKIQMVPKMKFFISESQQVPGEVVHYASVVKDGATIDFSSGPGLGKAYAKVTQESSGEFSVTYSDSYEY